MGRPLVRLQQRARTGDGSFLLLGASIPFETIQMEYNSVTCKVYLLKRSSSLETFSFALTAKFLSNSTPPASCPVLAQNRAPNRAPPESLGLVLWFGLPRGQKRRRRAPSPKLRFPQ